VLTQNLMTKLKIEYIRLVVAFIIFVFITSLLFIYVNQVKVDWFQVFASYFTIPSMVLIVGIPIWMIIDLVKKKVADKTIFNLTFFISVISVLMLLFAIVILKII